MMSTSMQNQNIDYADLVREVQGADIPESDKIARLFIHILSTQLEYGQRDIELLRAMGDRDGLVKTQIKLSTLEHARDVFQGCFKLATGRSWRDE